MLIFKTRRNSGFFYIFVFIRNILYMNYEDKKLKLIYILKIGYNTKDEGLYEFIFSLDHTNIDVEGWCWDLNPACDNAIPPS